MTAINGVEADLANINRQNKDLQKQIGQVKDFEQKKADLEKKTGSFEKPESWQDRACPLA